jgi:hypothetical protein
VPPPVKALRPTPPTVAVAPRDRQPAVAVAVADRRPAVAVAVAPRDRRPAAQGAVTVGADLLRAQAMVGNSAVAAMLQNAPGPVDPGALIGVGRTVAVPDRALDLAGTGPQPAAMPGPAGTLPPATTAAGPGAAATAKPGLKATSGAKPLAAAGAPDLTKDGKAAGKQQPGAAQEEAGAGGTKSAQRTPGADPKFQVLKKDVTTKKRAVGTSHPPASAEAGSAQAAAVPPKDDQEARGKVTHAGEMDAAQPKEFDREAFVKAVEEAIARKAPQNLEEADEFGDSGKAEEVKGEVQGKVGDGKDASAAEIKTTTAEAPTPAPDAKTVVPMTADRPPGRPAGPNPDLAAPDNLPPDATDLSAGPEQVGQQMADANVTKQQIALPNSKEPSFGKAVQETDKLEKHSEAAPDALRGAENREIKAVKRAAGAQGQAAMGAMHGTRVGTGQQVTAGKTGAKSTDEQKRAQVTAKLQAVFDATKTDVEKILEKLDDKVDKQFTDEEKTARNRFVRDHKEGMRRYKAERYSGFWGPGKWLKDKFLPLPDEANRIYERARDTYIAAMKQVIIRISYTVESSLRQAKDRISLGRTQLTATVQALPADLKAIGQSAAAEFADRFSELQDTVNEKGTELVQTVADRYTEAVKQVDDLIAKEKEKNKGLLAKAADAVKGVIDAIIDLKNMLMGMLRKAVAAIGAILKDPIGFLKNLISAVGGGLKLFMKNIGKHMQAGVLQWLLGTASSVGLQLPAKFDTRGIVQVLAMLMGLSWANIRGRITRKAPEPAVRAAETGVPLVAAVKKQGVGGMWSDLHSRVGDLKKDLISKVVKYLTPTIIIAGITWILSLLNPASAFIRACKMIIDIVRFIVTQGRQIIEFVNSVLDAVLAIARGGAGGVPGLVERALARSIPVLIGALAAILGIGGIAGKVKQIFQTLSKPVNRAVDWVIGKIVGLIKKLWAKLRPKRPKRPRGRKRGEPSRPRTPRRLGHDDAPRKPAPKAARTGTPRLLRAIAGILRERKFSVDGRGHTLRVKGLSSGDITVTIASTEVEFTQKLKSTIETLKALPTPVRRRGRPHPGDIVKRLSITLRSKKRLTDAHRAYVRQQAARLDAAAHADHNTVKKAVDDAFKEIQRRISAGLPEIEPVVVDPPEQPKLPPGFNKHREILYEGDGSRFTRAKIEVLARDFPDIFAHVQSIIKPYRDAVAVGKPKDELRKLKKDAVEALRLLTKEKAGKDATLPSKVLKAFQRNGHVDQSFMRTSSLWNADHIVPLAAHWHAIGFNSNDGPRVNATPDVSNLKLITAEANLAAQAEYVGTSYKFTQKAPGPNFETKKEVQASE